jgi:uncharacterized protein YkwD
MNRSPFPSRLPQKIINWLIKSSLLLTLPFVFSGCQSVQNFLEEASRELPILKKIASQPTPTPAQSSSTAIMEEQIWQEINAIRQQQGLTKLNHNDRLASVARKYSQKMAERKFFSHTSPDGDSVSDRVRSANIFYWMVGENLFRSANIAQPVPAAVEGWMNSPGHRANILRSEYRETGIGVWRIGNSYWVTQIFLRSIP